MSKCQELAWLLLQLEKLERQQSSGPAWLAECHQWHKDIKVVKVGVENGRGKGLMERGCVEVLEFYNVGLSLFFT